MVVKSSPRRRLVVQAPGRRRRGGSTRLGQLGVRGVHGVGLGGRHVESEDNKTEGYLLGSRKLATLAGQARSQEPKCERPKALNPSCRRRLAVAAPPPHHQEHMASMALILYSYEAALHCFSLQLHLGWWCLATCKKSKRMASSSRC